MNGQRSSRSIPTGPGSRGGLEPADRRAAWVAASPEYRAREAERRANRDQSIKADVPFSVAVREVLRDEASESSIRRVAMRLAVEHSTVSRWFADLVGSVSSDLIDAAVAEFGLDRIRSKRADLRRVA